MGWFRSNAEKSTKFEEVLLDHADHGLDRQRLSKKEIRAARDKKNRGHAEQAASLSSGDFNMIKQALRH